MAGEGTQMEVSPARKAQEVERPPGVGLVLQGTVSWEGAQQEGW